MVEKPTKAHRPRYNPSVPAAKPLSIARRVAISCSVRPSMMIAVPWAIPQVPRLRWSLTLPAPTSADCVTSRIIHEKKISPCRWTIGGAGGNVPSPIGTI